METVAHHGRETAYRATRFGEGDPVLYVHGAGGDHRLWTEQYGPEGIGPAVALDLSGHGESEDVLADPGPETLDTYAADVAAVARDTGARTLVGNSMGGAVCLQVALARDQAVDALVLCGTGAKLGVGDDLLATLEADFEAAVEAIHAPDLLFHDADAATLERSKAVFRETGDTVTIRDFRTCDSFDVRDRLADVDVPTLALTGEHDGMTPPSFTEYLGANLPDCETTLLPDCAHLSMVERPADWNERVRTFLASG